MCLSDCGGDNHRDAVQDWKWNGNEKFMNKKYKKLFNARSYKN